MTPTKQLTLWADRLRDIAAMGHHFARYPYDKTNYEPIQTIAMSLMALVNGDELADLEPLRAPIFSRPTPISVADAVVIEENGRILLIQRADNKMWAMPGGALEVGETLAQSTLREAFEGTGVHCELAEMAGIWDSRLCGTISRHHLYQFVFLARPLPDHQPEPPSHANEIIDMGWFTEQNLPANIDPGHINRIPFALAV